MFAGLFIPCRGYQPASGCREGCWVLPGWPGDNSQLRACGDGVNIQEGVSALSPEVFKPD